MGDPWAETFSEDWIEQPRDSPPRSEGNPPFTSTFRTNAGTVRILHERSSSSNSRRGPPNFSTGSVVITTPASNNKHAVRKEPSEWKRLVMQDFGASGGRDLFSPMHLECMFLPPTLGRSSAPPITEAPPLSLPLRPAPPPPIMTENLVPNTPKTPQNPVLFKSTPGAIGKARPGKSFIPVPSPRSQVLKEVSSAPASPRANTALSPVRKPPVPKRPSRLTQSNNKVSPVKPAAANFLRKGKRKADRLADAEPVTRSKHTVPSKKQQAQPHKGKEVTRRSSHEISHSRTSSEDSKKSKGTSPILAKYPKIPQESAENQVAAKAVPSSPVEASESQFRFPMPGIEKEDVHDEEDDTLGALRSDAKARLSMPATRKNHLIETPESSIYPSSPPALCPPLITSQLEQAYMDTTVDNDGILDRSELVEEFDKTLASPLRPPLKHLPPLQRQGSVPVEKSLASPFMPPVRGNTFTAPPETDSLLRSPLGERRPGTTEAIMNRIRSHKDAPKSLDNLRDRENGSLKEREKETRKDTTENKMEGNMDDEDHARHRDSSVSPGPDEVPFFSKDDEKPVLTGWNKLAAIHMPPVLADEPGPKTPAPGTPAVRDGNVKSSGSPLKLFHSFYDTYTNEKLRKRLGELEDDHYNSEEEEGSYYDESSEEEDTGDIESSFSGASVVVNHLEAIVWKQDKRKSQERRRWRSKGSGSHHVHYREMVEEIPSETNATPKLHSENIPILVSPRKTPQHSPQRYVSAPQARTPKAAKHRKHRRWKSDDSIEAINDGIAGPKSPVKERTPKRVRRTKSPHILRNATAAAAAQLRSYSSKYLRKGSKGSHGKSCRRVLPEPEAGSILMSSSRPRSAVRGEKTPKTPVTKAIKKSEVRGRGDSPTPSPRPGKKIPVLKQGYEYGDPVSDSPKLKNTPKKRNSGSRKKVFSGSEGDGMAGETFRMPTPAAFPSPAKSIGESETEAVRRGSVTTQDFLAQAEEIMQRLRKLGWNGGVGMDTSFEGDSFNLLTQDEETDEGSPIRRTGEVKLKWKDDEDLRTDSVIDAIIKEHKEMNFRIPHWKQDDDGDNANTRSSQGSQNSRASVEFIKPKDEVLNHHLAMKNTSGMIFDSARMAWVKNRLDRREGKELTVPGSDWREENTEEDPFLGISDLTVDSQEEARALELARRHWVEMTSDDNDRNGLLLNNRFVGDEDENLGLENHEDVSAAFRSWERRNWSAGAETSVGTETASRRFSDRSVFTNSRTETRTTSYGSTVVRTVDIDDQKVLPDIVVSGDVGQVEPENGSDIDFFYESIQDSKYRHPSCSTDQSSPENSVSMQRLSDSPEALPETWADPDAFSDLEADLDGFLDHGSLRQPSNGVRNISGGTYRGAARRRSVGKTTFMGRPVSRINEEEEEVHYETPVDLRRISLSSVLTPLPTPYQTQRSIPPLSTTRKNDVSFHLTPLPDLSYQFETTEALIGLELSFIASRRGPKASAKAIEASFSIATENLVKHLTDVEPYEPYWDFMKYLKLSDRKIETLHTLNEWCPRIEELDASNNQLGQLTGVPDTVKDLKVIGNCLSGITHWGHLVNLQYLDLSRNGLDSLEGLAGLRHLREIRADDNEIVDLEGVMNMEGLMVLRARRNKLKRVDLAKSSLNRLTELDLRGNEIEKIAGLENLPSLIHLNLDQNKLNDLGLKERSRLETLRSLKLTQNIFKTLDVSQFPTLRILYIDNNRLARVDGLSRAKNLESISMREQDVPECSLPMERMYEARKIYMSGNPIRNLEFKLDFLNLQYLELASAQLTELPKDFGQMFCNARVLNLNYNAITDLKPLYGMLRLKKLLLVGNRVKSLRKVAGMLGYWPSLGFLDLRCVLSL
ncbi:Protein nud1 [Rhizina undulata]